MAKPPINFRLSSKELELLEKEKKEGESISLTAARLLRERLGVMNSGSPEDQLQYNTLTAFITSEVNKTIESVKNAFEIMNEDKEKEIYEEIENCKLALRALETVNREMQKKLDEFIASNSKVKSRTSTSSRTP